MERLLQGMDVAGIAEASTKVAGGGGVGDTASAERVEEGLVVAAQLDVLQTGTFAQGVVGNVEDVIGLVVGQMDLEQNQPAVNGLGKPEPLREGMNGTDAAVGDAAIALADLVMDVAGGEHRPLAAFEVELVEASLDSALASVQLSAYLDFHSKSLAGCGD